MNSSPQQPTGPDADRSSSGGYTVLPGRQLWLALSGIMLAMFISALSQTLIVTAMPQIIIDLGGFDRYTWGSTAYLLASIVVTPIAGRLTDIHGPKIFFIVGGAIFILGTIFGGLSQTMGQVIIFRGIQGIGGGIMMITCFVAIAYILPSQQRAKPQGILSAVLALAWVVGPPLGGAIADGLTWRWVFWLNIPVGVVMLLLIMWTFPRVTLGATERRLDYPGMFTLAGGVGLSALGLSLGGSYHAWDSPLIIVLLALGVAMVLAFVAIQISSEAPIMPLEIYRIRMVTTCVVVSLITGFGLYATMMLTPLALQAVLHLSPTGSGGLFTPLLVGLMVGAFASGQLLTIAGQRYRLHIIVGAILMVVGLYSISTLNDGMALVQVAVFVSVYGLGTGVVLAATTVAVQNTVPLSVLGASTAALHFYRQVGGLLGLSLLGALLTQRFSSNLNASVPDGALAAAPFAKADAVQQDPHSLIDPAVINALSADGDASKTEAMLHTILHDALATALSEVFALAAAAVALCIVASLFIPPGGDRKTVSVPPVAGDGSRHTTQFPSRRLSPAGPVLQRLLRRRIFPPGTRDSIRG